MNTSDDELQKIFRKNREEILQERPPSGTSTKIPWVPCKVAVPVPPPPGEKSPPGGFVSVDSHSSIIEFDDPVKTISSLRDLAFEEKVWQQKIQPISDRYFNGEFQYEPSPDVVELTNESITLVHYKIFQIFNKLIDFPNQLKQMAPSPSIDPARSPKELIIAFDDVVLKKLRGGLGNPEKNELFFDFLQDIYDTNSLPAFLTYLGVCMTSPKHQVEGTKGRLKPKTQAIKKTKQKTIPTPPKTQWHQVHFRIVSPTRIEIKTPDGMEPYHPDDLGFTPKIWDQFEQFASDIKHIPSGLDGRSSKIYRSEDRENIKGKVYRSEAPEYIKAEKSDISRLRRLLKKAFPGVNGDPILYVKGKRYKAEFNITEADR